MWAHELSAPEKGCLIVAKSQVFSMVQTYFNRRTSTKLRSSWPLTTTWDRRGSLSTDRLPCGSETWSRETRFLSSDKYFFIWRATWAVFDCCRGRTRAADSTSLRTGQALGQHGDPQGCTSVVLSNEADHMVTTGKGKVLEAAPLYERTQGIFEKSLGRDHPNNVAAILNNPRGTACYLGAHEHTTRKNRSGRRGSEENGAKSVGRLENGAHVLRTHGPREGQKRCFVFTLLMMIHNELTAPARCDRTQTNYRCNAIHIHGKQGLGRGRQVARACRRNKCGNRSNKTAVFGLKSRVRHTDYLSAVGKSVTSSLHTLQ